MQIVAPQAGQWLSFHGLPVELIMSCPEFDLSRAKVSAQSSASPTPAHSHRFAEGFYLLQGELSFRVGRENLTLQAGDYLHIAPDSVHQPLGCGPEGAEVLVLTFPAGFSEFQKSVGQLAPGPQGPFAPPPADIGPRMLEQASRFGIELQPRDEKGEYHLARWAQLTPWAAVGDLYRFLCQGCNSQQAYALWHAVIAPGAGPPPHRHSREHELFYVLQGQLQFHYQDQSLLAQAGTCLLLPPGPAHFFGNPGAEPAECLIMVVPAGLETMFFRTGQDWSGRSQLPPPPDGPEVARLLQIAPEYGIEILH